MAFMQPDIQYFTAYEVETTCGTEFVPTAVCGKVNNVADLLAYIEGSPQGDDDAPVDKATGWWSRLSAPGYMDCTDWSGPYDTRAEAKAALVDLYDVDPDTGDELAD